MRNSFLIYADYEKYFDMLAPTEQSKLIKALFMSFREEGTSEIEANMEGMTQMAFAFMNNQLRIDSKRYEEKCEKLKANASKSKQSLANASKSKQSLANEGDIDIDTDIEKEIDISKKKQEKKKTPSKKNATVKNTILADGELDILIDKSFTDPDVKAKFRDYANMRAGMGKNKAIRTRATFDGCVKKIRSFAKTKQQAIDILDESITNNWTGLFALKQEAQSVEEAPYAN